MDEPEALRKENAEQRGQLAEQRAQISQLIEQLARLNERVSELLAVAQRKQRKPAAAAALPPAAPPVIEDDARRAFEERPKAPEKPAKERPQKKKQRPTGRKPIPSHLETEEHELRPDTCAECGGSGMRRPPQRQSHRERREVTRAVGQRLFFLGAALGAP